MHRAARVVGDRRDAVGLGADERVRAALRRRGKRVPARGPGRLVPGRGLVRIRRDRLECARGGVGKAARRHGRRGVPRDRDPRPQVGTDQRTAAEAEHEHEDDDQEAVQPPPAPARRREDRGWQRRAGRLVEHPLGNAPRGRRGQRRLAAVGAVDLHGRIVVRRGPNWSRRSNRCGQRSRGQRSARAQDRHAGAGELVERRRPAGRREQRARSQGRTPADRRRADQSVSVACSVRPSHPALAADEHVRAGVEVDDGGDRRRPGRSGGSRGDAGCPRRGPAPPRANSSSAPAGACRRRLDRPERREGGRAGRLRIRLRSAAA